MLSKALTGTLLAGLVVLLGSTAALATYPPPPGMLERMKAEGTLAASQEFARSLGNYEQKKPKRGAFDTSSESPQDIADMIAQNLGRSLGDRGASDVGRMTSSELSWVELDLNHDGTVDERDLLVLGHPQPKQTATLPSLGYDKMLNILIEFPDYPHFLPAQSIHDVCYSPDPVPGYHLGSMRYFYDKASYGNCTLDGDTFGWYMAQHPRSYYHPDDNSGGGLREELILEACDAAEAAGQDFSQYDNDGDGVIDEFIVIWTGPHGDWATFWWGYHTGMGNNKQYDGVRLGSYSWQWERAYYFGNQPPEPSVWDADVVIHETGHGFGLPDYYDYDGSVGPNGGLGSMDRMDGYRGEHNCYTKYILGWTQPTIAYKNLNDEELDRTDGGPDAVLFMPGYDPATPWDEYFMAENRGQQDIDHEMPGTGLLLWHVDARVNAGGGQIYNNSYTSHKLIRLMEADGLEQIENVNGWGDAGDYYKPGSSLGPATTPSSAGYDAATGMTVNDVQGSGQVMTADFNLYPSAPPTISISGMTPGSTVSGNVPLVITATHSAPVDRITVWVDGVPVETQYNDDAIAYTWNTRVDFNRTMDVTARVYDSNGQSATDTVTVSVSNSGITSFVDFFNTGLGYWRSTNFPESQRGTWTQWATRACPASPPPLSGGNEAWVKPQLADNEWHNANDNLRTQRFDATAFTHLTSVSFEYRCRDGLSLWSTVDNGESWNLIDTLSPSSDWTAYNRTLDFSGTQFYLELRYSGSVRADDNSGLGANIDNVHIAQAPSDPPTVSLTSHAEGDSISTETTFTAEAADDISVSSVKFYVNGGLASTDTEAPYEYYRNLRDEDNRPGVEVRVVATDGDGLNSEPDIRHINWATQRPFPLFDDCEISDDSGPNAWTFQNTGGPNPDWQWNTTQSYSGSQAIAWTGSNPMDGDDEGLWFWGSRSVAEGRVCVDLANPKVVDPVLRYKMKGSFLPNSGRGMYLFTTWYGFEWIDGWGSDNGEWVDVEVNLGSRLGQSGRLVWWIWGEPGSAEGIWLDDIEVTNATPQIDSVSPGAGKDGDLITLSGIGFSSADIKKSLLLPQGVELFPADCLSWTDQQIQFAIPAGLRSGSLTVNVNDHASNPMNLTVRLASPTLGGIGQF